MASILGCTSQVNQAQLDLDRLVEPAAEISEDDLRVNLDKSIQLALEGRVLSSTRNAAWQIMHGVLCFGSQLPLETPDRGTLSALDYALTGGQFEGWELSRGDKLSGLDQPGVKARLEPGSFIGQGHVDQWIAIMAMAQIPIQTRVIVDGQSLTLTHWARQAQWDACSNPLREYSWSLIALTQYFPNEPVWQTSDGQNWSWERMVEQEVLYDLTLSPCGGTHRLMGLVLALQGKQRLNLADSNAWRRAREIVDQAVDTIRTMQNSDGSLSSHYLVRPGTSSDLGATLGSSGHLLEFLSAELPPEQLSQAWVERAVARVCEIIQVTSSVDIDCGALYHAVRGLKLYREKRFAAKTYN